MLKKLIVANLKMNPKSAREAERLFGEIKKTASKLRGVEAVFCPPFIFISNFQSRAASLRDRSPASNLKIGAQDVFWKDEGAYTGEISPIQLKKLGIKYVIIGHSERREHLGETDEMINKKIKAALKAGLKVILCVGEKEREEDALPQVVRDELTSDLAGVARKYAKNIILAYEPIWAIGTGKAVRPEDLLEMTIFIRRVILDVFGKKTAHEIPILYGGSVNDKNALKFLEVNGVYGLLVGGASLDAKKFREILRQASS